MPQFKYLGPKVYRRQIPPDEAPPAPTVEEVQPGDVVDELTEAEMTAFGDRFVVVGDEGVTAQAYALEHAEELREQRQQQRQTQRQTSRSRASHEAPAESAAHSVPPGTGGRSQTRERHE